MRIPLLAAAVICCFSAAYSGNTSTEAVNPFNQFMDPSGGVNMFSGDAAVSLPITSVEGLSIALSYSSNIERCVRARNDISPTGWVGLGWRLGFGAISCDHKGTKTHSDDDFYYISPVGVSSKLHKTQIGRAHV